jgi:hypothetical protein
MKILRRRVGTALVEVAVVAAVIGISASSANAQQQTQPPPSRAQPTRRAETIEIRGQVPTPQVVTVRPRETPQYSRRVLVPGFLDRSFWPSILPALQIVSPVAVPTDTASRTPDSASVARPAAARTPSGTPPAPLRP